MILARVNGYYSPYFPSTIMQEEDQAETGEVFNLAEENFFKHRLKTLYPKIDEEGIKTAIGFLATQNLVNCPCTVHAEERGYKWIVFRRQPDRKIDSTEDDNGDNSITDSISDDDVFFSAEAEEALLGPMATTPESERDLEKKNSSTDVSDGCKEKAKPQMSNQLRDSSLHSREERDEPSTSTHQTDQEKKKKTKKKEKKIKTDGTTESPMILDDEDQTEGKEIPKKRKGFSYYPLLTYNRNLDKTFYYKYFKPYSHDYRRLRMEEDCQCPQTESHDTKCEWYDPNIIYILEKQDDISGSEEAAQQKIYDLYMSSMNSTHHYLSGIEYCGCSTAAEIAYMGHHTGSNEFQYIHERVSYEVLLAMLKKKKKVSFPGCPFNKNKRPRLQSPKLDAEPNDDKEEIPMVKKTPRAKLSQETIELLAEAAESAFDAGLPKAQPTCPPPNPPNNPPEPLSDQIEKSEDGVNCINGEPNGEPDGESDEEMPPLVDETGV